MALIVITFDNIDRTTSVTEANANNFSYLKPSPVYILEFGITVAINHIFDFVNINKIKTLLITLYFTHCFVNKK